MKKVFIFALVLLVCVLPGCVARDAEGQTITVGPGEHVALTLNTNVELTPVS